jgi:hypothetical protein
MRAGESSKALSACRYCAGRTPQSDCGGSHRARGGFSDRSNSTTFCCAARFAGIAGIYSNQQWFTPMACADLQFNQFALKAQF